MLQISSSEPLTPEVAQQLGLPSPAAPSSPEPASPALRVTGVAQLPKVQQAVDVLAPGNEDAFLAWEKLQGDAPVWDRVKEAAGHVGRGFVDTLKEIGGVVKGANPYSPDAVNQGKHVIATGAEVVANAYKGFATIGALIKMRYNEREAEVAKTWADKNSPEYAAAEKAGAAARQEFYRTARDLNQSTNDGRVIANSLISTAVAKLDGSPEQNSTILNEPVSDSAAQFMSNFVDPTMAGVMVKAGARSIGLRLLYRAPHEGFMAAIERELASSLLKRTELKEAVDVTRAAGGDAAQLEAKLASETTQWQRLLDFHKEQQSLLQSQHLAQAEEAARKGILQRSIGSTVSAAGRGVEGVANVVGAVNRKIENFAAQFGDGGGESVVNDAIKKVPGVSPLLGGTEDMLRGVGNTVATVGKYISAPESSLGYFQSLSRALPPNSVGRWAASKAERVEFLASTGRWVMDTAEDTARTAAIGSVFGAMGGDPVSGATQGALFGMAGSQFGQFMRMNSPLEVALQQGVDVNVARSRRANAPGEQAKLFDQAAPGLQLAVATFEQAHPDLHVQFTREGGKGAAGWYSFTDGVGQITLDLDHKSPALGLVQHELKHHIYRNPEIRQAILTKLLGDADAGVPGIFTERDASGKPVLENVVDPANPEITRRQFKTNAEFQAIRETYLQRLRDRGLPTTEYEADPTRIADEVWAESESANLLHRQENGKFDVIAERQMGPVQRKLADLLADSDLVRNSTTMQKVLAKFGVVFDSFSGKAANTALFGKTTEIPGVRELVRKYYRANEAERVGDGEDAGPNVRQYTEDEILRSPVLQDMFNSGHDVVRDPVTGKMRFISEREAKAKAKEFTKTLVDELRSYAGTEPGVLKEIRITGVDGRPTSVWFGRKVPETVIAKIESSGRFNPVVIENLRALNRVIAAGKGNEVNFKYQPASKRGGRLYRTRPITERTESPMTMIITRDGNLLTNTISQEKLQRNAVEAVKSGRATLWANNYQALWADVGLYLENHANGLSGDANGLGTEKRDFINSLFGQLTKEQRNANPFLQDVSERKARNAGIVQSRRLDRLSMPRVLSSEFKPDYGKVSRNFSPASEPDISRLTREDKRVLVETGRWLLDREENPNAAKVKDWPSLMKYAPGRVEEISRWALSHDFGDRIRPVDISSETGQPVTNGKADVDGRGVVDRAGGEAGARRPSQAGEVQLQGEKLPHSVGKETLDLVHYSNSLSSENPTVDPQFMGKGAATARDMRGVPGSFWFEKGSPLAADETLVAKGRQTYSARVSGSRIYDSNAGKDKLGYWKEINREKADQKLIDAGYAGVAVTTPEGRKVVKLFEPVDVVHRGLAKEGGRASYSPADAAKQTDTPEFKRWFRDSRVTDENGDPLVVYHGTLTDFTKFDRAKGNPESDFGSGFYFSNHPSDVARNYSSQNGPDHAHKIERLSEILEANDGLTPEEARAEALRRLSDHEGATMPVYLSLKKPAVLGGDNETRLEARVNYRTGEIKGSFGKFLDGLREAVADFHDADVEKTISNLSEKFAYDGGAKLSDVLAAAKQDDGLTYVTNDNGDLVSGEVLRRALEHAGFDGIIDHTVSDKFSNMGLSPDTTHYIAFEPTQIKSATGNRGTFSSRNPDIRYSPGAKIDAARIRPDEDVGVEPIPAGDRDPIAYGDKFFLSPDGRWISVEEHEDAAKAILKQFGKRVDTAFRGDMNEWQATLQEKYGFARVVDDGDTLWVTTSRRDALTAEQSRQLELQAIERETTLKHEFTGADGRPKEVTLYSPPQADESGIGRSYSPGAKVGVAPLRATSVDHFSADALNVAKEPLTQLENLVSSAAGKLGLSAQAGKVIGGWQDTETKAVSREASLRVVIPEDTDVSRVKALASYLGEHAPERQNAVLVFEPGNGPDVEHAIKLPDAEAANLLTSKLADFGLGAGFSFDPASSTLYLITPASDTNVTNLLSYAKANNLFRGHSTETGTATFIGSDEYARHIQTAPEFASSEGGADLSAGESAGRSYSPGLTPGEQRDLDKRISTRVPTAKASTDDPIASQLGITAKDVLTDYDATRAAAAAIRKYPNLPKRITAPKEVLKDFTDQVVQNLLWLHDQFDPALRDRAKLWYDGARKITESWSDQYNHPTEAVAGVLAALSPQKDWFMNVDLGRRVIEHLQTLKDREVGDDVVDWFRGAFGERKPDMLQSLELSRGEPFSSLGLLEKAIVLRAYDEIAADRGYKIVTPEGKFSGPATNNDGRPSKVAWGDFNTIAKAISILEKPTRENISNRLGNEHKVRNFFNNILLPNDGTFGDVTIDTHAVAAALLRPLSGSSVEVLQNFGGGGAFSSSISGASGFYGLYADAYRTAAKERGHLPREMQSITWEAVRGLFTPEFKTEKNQQAVDSVWENYKKGNLSLDDVRTQINSLAGGIRTPSWAGPNR